ncbi:Actin-depolymerizing factor 1, partial [Operophtera brumata]
MSLNPLNELKRCLDDETTTLPKRLCLARNMVHSHHFPTAPKERIIAGWLEGLSKSNKLDSAELQKVLDWLSCDDLTAELKCKLIQFIIKFIENDKISLQMSQQIDDYLRITVTLLQCLKGTESTNLQLSQKIFNNFVKYYKDSKKKLEMITKFIEGENLETVFSYLDTENRNTVIEVCKNVLFHDNKKSFYINYLQTLVRKDSLDNLIAEKGDNIQSVLKIMTVFFDFPKHRTENDAKFLRDFIEVFVSSYKNEGQMIFAFYIMIANVLNMKQDYITPSITLTPIENTEKDTRDIFLSMLEIVLSNEVDITVRLTDTFGAKVSKVEIKKSFLSFLQAVMMGQLKLEGKLDKTTLQIIKTALKLDPILVEQNLELILPPIMIAKKSSTVMESYKEMLNCLMEILFKLSRGNLFITEILPSLKLNLMAIDNKQIELNKKIKASDDDKSKSRLLAGNDVFPQECVELYGKLTTDLMFRQNKELLESLQKDFQMHCLSTVGDETISPSTTILAEVLSAILSSFLRHNKMADHTVPQNIAEEFWGMYTAFENGGLKKFGLAVLKFNDNTPLLMSFLQLCQNYAQLKLLNIKYSHYKLDVLCTSEVFDLSGLLPCLERQQWIDLGTKVTDSDALLVLDNLLLLKTMAMEVLVMKNPHEDSSQALQETKSYLIKRLASNPAILESNTYIPRVLFANLDKTQYKQLSKSLVKLYLNDEVTEIFKNVAITNNRLLLNAIVLEVSKNVVKCFQNCDDLAKALSKEFNMISFAKGHDIKAYFNGITIEENSDEKIKKCIELMKTLQISYLEENYQLTAVFVLLATKKCCQSKKIKRTIDGLLQNIFELSIHPPDLYQVFPVDFIFCFKDTSMIDLLTLRIKTSNQLLVIKNLIESAVKRVRIESDLVKKIVELLLPKKSSKTASTIEAFSDPKFQISCIILPLLVKQRKAITTSAFRSILADLQEKLHKPLLDTFKNVDFSKTGNISLVTGDKNNSVTGHTEDSIVESDSSMTVMVTLNAMAAYSLTLSKYCESTDKEDVKNLDCLWSGLEFFVDNAPHHIESAIQLLNVTLRHIKKLESHNIFNDKDKLFTQIWFSINSRLLKDFENGGSVRKFGYLEELGVILNIFELQHMVHLILGFNTSHIRCDISWPAFFALYEGSVGILNSLLVCREEILEDRMVRQHLENSVALLIQASDSTYAMAFLKRALAGSVGQMTMSNLYIMYK